LVAAGLQEAITYRLVDAATDDSASAEAPEPSDVGAGADAQPATSDHIRLANPISPERSALRKSLPASLLEVARANLRHRDRVHVFEIGPVFIPAAGLPHARAAERLPRESWRLGIVLAGPARDATWREHTSQPVDFYHIKGVVDRLASSLGVAAEWRAGAEHASLHPSRSATLMSGDRLIGHAGELHPLVAERWAIDGHAVTLAELELDALVEARSGPSTFRPFSSFPPVKEDLAVVVAEDVAAADVARVIATAGGDLVASAELFDVYRGRQIGSGNKSLAWSLVLQAPDRTLTDDEAARVRARIVEALERELGAELRT
jgi:phenylalanyl-tRNA synthetase beta chain